MLKLQQYLNLNGRGRFSDAEGKNFYLEGIPLPFVVRAVGSCIVGTLYVEVSSQ